MVRCFSLIGLFDRLCDMEQGHVKTAASCSQRFPWCLSADVGTRAAALYMHPLPPLGVDPGVSQPGPPKRDTYPMSLRLTP